MKLALLSDINANLQALQANRDRPDGSAVMLVFGLSCHAHFPDLMAEELRQAVVLVKQSLPFESLNSQ